MTFRIVWVLAISLLTTVGAASAGAQQNAETVALDIAPQPLGTALNAFAQQAGLQVVFFSAVSGGIISPRLAGRYTAQAALEKLLANTLLSYEFINARTVAIRSAQLKDGSNTGTAMPRNALAADRELKLAGVDEPATVQRSETPLQSSKDAKASSGDGEEKLQEILVTARKRTENIQDVPISIAVVTAEDIDRRGLVNGADYLRGIAGANQVEGGYGGQAIIIRGIETNTMYQGYRAGSATATYFGETPTTGSAGLVGSSVDIKLVDIERVEVLKGPQGTAYGSSSMGGAVRIIPVAPKLNAFEGKLGTGYSTTSGTGGPNYQFQAVGNMPLVRDKLAIRAAAYSFSDSGYYRNRAGSDPAFQAVAASFGAQAYATDEEEAGAHSATGGRISALFQATNDLRFTFSYLTQKDQTDGWAQATSGTYEQTLFRVAPEHVRRGQNEGVSDTRVDIGNAVMEYDLGWTDLLATYSYIDGGTVAMHPYAALGGAYLWAASDGRDADFKGHTGEIRLATKLQGAWNFLVGLYGERNTDRYQTTVWWHGDPATNFFTPGQRFLFDALDRRELQQRAAFGEVSWKFLPAWTFTGGVRAYKYDRTVRFDQSGYFAGGSPPPTRNTVDADGTNFRANLSYKPAEQAILYAGWAQGFRLGKPQLGAPAGICDRDGDGLVDGTNVTVESTTRVDSDTVDSYEIGGKFALLDRRLAIDAAVFRMEWSGLPVDVRPPLCIANYAANAGGARSRGVEVQANFLVTNALRVDIGGSYIDARLTEDVPAQGFFADDRLPGTPKVNGNLGLQYEFDVAGRTAFVRADAIYMGSFFGNVLESPSTEAGGYVKLDATARLVVDKLNIDLFVRNLTNEDAFTFRDSYAFTGPYYGYRLRPRTIGVQLGYSF